MAKQTTKTTTEELTFHERVIAIQGELKAPKSQYNSFGKYSYRNQEDILEAVKPLLTKYGLSLTITDEIKEVGGLVFVEARAILHSPEGSVEAKAQAGIDPNRKGMDISQSFGSSSSYARKYCLNGMFLIDDNRDSDTTNTHGKETNSAQQAADLVKKPWLNEGTPEFAKAQAYVKAGNSVADIKKKYSISKTVEAKLLA
tara:strand:- start:4172 stop:4771 length:600 start_codon:yes stop_codon:yes gene_type:complete